MDSPIDGDVDLAKFLQPPDQWPNFKGYLPLSTAKFEIRLLKIFLNPGTQDICASVIHADLEDPKIQFEALSYQWGPPDRLKPVRINGQEVFVRGSLHSFLFALCQRDQVSPIWVDAICIDQRNVQERNHQVAMMGVIYSCATCTNVWLGEPNPETEYCLSYLQHCNNLRLQNSRYHARVQRKASESFEEILKRPYWARLWIVQEVTLSREVFVWCGQRRLSWKAFVDGAKSLTSGVVLQQKSVNTIMELHASREYLNSTTANTNINAHVRLSDNNGRRKDMPNLEKRMKQFIDQRCEDIRDKIYALKSIASDGKDIEVNYHKNIVEVLAQLASGSQTDLFAKLNTALSLWSSLRPPISTGELFFTTNIFQHSPLLYTPCEMELYYNSSLTLWLIAWAADFTATQTSQKPVPAHKYQMYGDSLHNIGGLAFIPSKLGDWPRPEDIVCRGTRTAFGFLQSALFIVRQDDVNPFNVRIVGCLIDKKWSPLVISSQFLHPYWARKQVQICNRVDFKTSGEGRLHFHYSQEALLVMMGLQCVPNFHNRHPDFLEAHYNLKTPALLDTCDCESNVQSTECMEAFQKVSLEQARGWVNFPGKLPRVREAIELRTQRLAQLQDQPDATS